MIDFTKLGKGGINWGNYMQAQDPVMNKPGVQASKQQQGPSQEEMAHQSSVNMQANRNPTGMGAPSMSMGAVPTLPTDPKKMTNEQLRSLVDYYAIGQGNRPQDIAQINNPNQLQPPGAPVFADMNQLPNGNLDMNNYRHNVDLLSQALGKKYGLGPTEQTNLGREVQMAYWQQAIPAMNAPNNRRMALETETIDEARQRLMREKNEQGKGFK